MGLSKTSLEVATFQAAEAPALVHPIHKVLEVELIVLRSPLLPSDTNRNQAEPSRAGLNLVIQVRITEKTRPLTICNGAIGGFLE